MLSYNFTSIANRSAMLLLHRHTKLNNLALQYNAAKCKPPAYD